MEYAWPNVYKEKENNKDEKSHTSRNLQATFPEKGIVKYHYCASVHNFLLYIISVT